MNTMRKVILGLEAFVAVTALVGGALLMARPDGGLLKLDVAIMNGTFSSFTIPGVLLFALGALQALAAWLMARGSRYDTALSAFAGAILTLWIAAQMIFIGVGSVQQILFAAIGFAIYSLAMDLVHEGHGPHWLPTDDELRSWASRVGPVGAP